MVASTWSNTAVSTGTQGRVRRIETRTGGDFNGSFSLREFHSDSGAGPPGLIILGDLNADVTFTKQLSGNGQISITGDLAVGKTIEIKSHLTGPIIIQNSAGLKGQIIVNSGDVGGAWTGNVTVGGTTLLPKGAYVQTGLGGGAVGLVAFDCHFEDCVPPATSSTPGVLGSSSTNVAFKVTLTHYGPVTWTSDMPIQVRFCPAGTECDPTDVTSDFKVTSSKEQRFVVVEPIEGKPDAGEYHFSPKVDVKCFGISAGTPPSVVSYTYDLEFNMN